MQQVLTVSVHGVASAAALFDGGSWGSSADAAERPDGAIRSREASPDASAHHIGLVIERTTVFATTQSRSAGFNSWRSSYQLLLVSTNRTLHRFTAYV